MDDFCINFCNVVETHCKYIIVSGFIVIASGRARGTEDIDMIIPKLARSKFFELQNDLIKHGFTCMQSDNPDEVLNYLNDNTSVRYTYLDVPLPGS